MAWYEALNLEVYYQCVTRQRSWHFWLHGIFLGDGNAMNAGTEGAPTF